MPVFKTKIDLHSNDSQRTIRAYEIKKHTKISLFQWFIKTNPNFNFEPKTDTSKIIWSYLSSSNLLLLENSSFLQQLQWYVPFDFSLRYLPEKGLSVPDFRVT